MEELEPQGHVRYLEAFAFPCSLCRLQGQRLSLAAILRHAERQQENATMPT